MSSLRERIEFSGREELLVTLKIQEPRDYSEFVEVLYSELDRAVALLEHDAGDFMDSDEDRISREICRLLSMRGFYATHETDQGGHVDLTVTSSNRKYEWLGEAKRWKGPAYIHDGFDQLLNRYSSGAPGKNHGALLIYVQIDKCAEKLCSWRARLESHAESYPQMEFFDDNYRVGLTFSTQHQHERMGEGVPPYCTRHMAISLYRPAGVTPA